MNTTVQTNRGAVECAITGEGPAVLLLHGAMGGCDQGQLLARAAVGPSRHTFIAVSRPGYLGTPLSSGRTPEEQADLYAGILDSLGIPQAAVVAVSGGGQSALQFAIRHPERCLALVMISACSAPMTERLPFAYNILKLAAHVPALAAVMARRAARNPDRVASRSIPDPVLRSHTLNHPEAGPLLLALQQSTMDRMALRLPGTENDVFQSRRRFSYSVDQISAPLLVVHGTADRTVPFSQSSSLARLVPGAELLAIEGGEHVSLFTHLDLIRARTNDFLSLRLPLPRHNPAVQ